MESTVSSSWRITPIGNSAMPQDCFSIIFIYTKELIKITQRYEVDFSSTRTTEKFLVPSNILCSCTPFTDLSREDTILLHEIFSSMSLSPALLDQILPAIGETARKILSGEGCDSNTREIVVYLRVVTTHKIVVQDPELTQLVNLLEGFKIDEQDDDVECAICLEKFGHGNEDSSVEVVRINCSHVFHDRCMLRWLRRCANCQSPYSCPLCRCIISPTSHSDNK